MRPRQAVTRLDPSAMIDREKGLAYPASHPQRLARRVDEVAPQQREALRRGMQEAADLLLEHLELVEHRAECIALFTCRPELAHQQQIVAPNDLFSAEEAMLQVHRLDIDAVATLVARATNERRDLVEIVALDHGRHAHA